MDSSSERDAKPSGNGNPFLWIAAMPALLIHTCLILLTLVAVCILRITNNVSQAFTEQILTLIVSTVLGGGAVSVGTKLGGKPNGNNEVNVNSNNKDSEVSS